MKDRMDIIGTPYAFGMDIQSEDTAVIRTNPERLSADMLQFFSDSPSLQVAFQTIDHSVAQLSVFSGEITQAQLRGYAGRNHLLRALGAEEEVQVELNDLEIQPGDRFLLCSDGFWELILEEEMLSWGGEDTAAQWLERMKALAVSRCGAQGDNHSAIAIVVTEGTEDAN